ncbi:MAG: MBL fold metallo-hydrolase [Clostridia bacterium]
MKKFKRVIIIICIGVAVFSLTSFGNNFWVNISKTIGNREFLADDYNLSVHFLDVGCADCILIEYEDYVFLIDTGTENSYDNINTYLQKRSIEKIDIMFLSHADSDHIGGAYKIIEDYQVDSVYINNVVSTSEAYSLLLNATQNMDFVMLNESQNMNFGDLNFEITVFDNENSSSNNASLIIKLEFYDLDILFTGDAEEETENLLVENSIDIQSDILKVGHHGSSSSSTLEFLAYVDPILAIISTGENSYSFPSYQVLNNLDSLQIDYLRTDEDGNVMILTNDGTNLIISTKDEKYEILNN